MTYTPTTEGIRKYYGLGRYEFSPGVGAGHPNEFYQEFDRWHAAELRKAKAEALRDYADDLGVDTDPYNDGEWWDGYRQAQREFVHKTSRRADQIEEDQ